ncbi:MAG: carboxylesterase/lipase family protein [Sediminibacterium sp.]
MKKLLLFAMFLVAFFQTKAQSQSAITNSLVLKVEGGSIKGLINQDVVSYKGIPFAAPPVGQLRWRAPQPVIAWDGVRDASNFGKDCAQAAFGPNADSISKTSSEDCLCLNVWAPSKDNSTKKLPVMVWIHGGAFMFGSGAQQDFSGEKFAKQGVILVTINYRLGRLGFFAFPALTKEQPKEFKGNYAYMDQIAALKWVQNNISAFGGDPNNVTIFGESAGGVSVQSLISIPSAKGLFQKGIIESGGGRDGVLTARPINRENADSYYPVSAETIGVNFAKRYGITETDENGLAKLRALTVAQIIDKGQEKDASSGATTYAGPILDGKLVVETAQSFYNSNNPSNVSVMIGSNSAEVPAGFVNAQNKDELFSLFGKMKEEAKQVYDEDGKTEFGQILSMVNTDKVWAEPARFTANAITKKGGNAYVYLFSYISPSMKQYMRYGAAHASEISYVFDNLRSRNNDPVNETDKAVATMMNTYWANFAKYGNPNVAGLAKWPKYSTGTDELIEFLGDGTAIGKANPKKKRLDLIQKAVESGNLH